MNFSSKCTHLALLFFIILPLTNAMSQELEPKRIYVGNYGNPIELCLPIQTGNFSFSAQGAMKSIDFLFVGNLPDNNTNGRGQYGQVAMGMRILQSTEAL